MTGLAVSHGPMTTFLYRCKSNEPPAAHAYAYRTPQGPDDGARHGPLLATFALYAAARDNEPETRAGAEDESE
ncbi:MAG: hypothetical protein Q9201_003458, partial [Fulgogasparrea decipioides]